MTNILFITTEWPTENRPTDVPFLVKYAAALREIGIHIDVFHFRGCGNPLNYLKAWLAVRRIPAWKTANILHAHWGQSAFVSLLSPKPLVITYHGSDLKGITDEQGKYNLKGKFLITFSKWVARRADHCITVSIHLKNILPPSVQADVIPMGVDLELFRPMNKLACRQQLGIDPKKKIVLFVSNPSRTEKRYALAEQVVNQVRLSHPDKFIELLPVFNQPISQMPYFLNAADVLLITSSHEGAPVIIKEALACNVPIVATNVGDIQERIGNIKGCYVCEDDSIETISSNLSSALSCSKRVNGRETIKELSWRIIAKKTKSVYKNILSKKNK
mgnify:CR=1 FL=1